jgi:hypothetical protein
MNVFSQLLYARIHQTASDLAETISGLIWQNTTTPRLKYYNGSAVKELVELDTAQTLTNKTLTSPVITTPTGIVKSDVGLGNVDNTSDATKNAASATLTNKTITTPIVTNPNIDLITFDHQTTPSAPAAGKTKFYIKNTNKVYIIDSDGVERPVGSGGGGSSLIWEKLGDLSPSNESQDGIRLEGFGHTDVQELYLSVNVPSDYVAGTQITLLNGAFFISATSGNILFRTVTSLIRAATTVLGTYSNSHTSTNTEITANGVSNTLTNVGDIDLTDSDGLINGVAVAANDKLRIKLTRAIATETSSAAAIAKLMINNLDIKFSA